MRIAVIGDRLGGHTDALAQRLRAEGHDVTGPVDDLDELDAGLAFDVGVDACVVDRARKVQALQRLADHLAPDAPLLTCCHGASATAAASQTPDPARVVGYSWLAPWEDRDAVECAEALQTDDAFADSAEAFWAEAGFEVVWVGDSSGLVMPRIVACLANEAAFAVMEQVADPEDIDRAMELGTRYPRGPLAWAESIGLPEVVAILDGLAAEHGEERYRAAPLLRRMAQARTEWPRDPGAAEPPERP